MPPCVTSSTVRRGARARSARPPRARARQRAARASPPSGRSPPGKRSSISACVRPDQEPTSISRRPGSAIDRHAVRRGDDLGRLVRAPQVARVDGVERRRRASCSASAARLLAAGLVQRRVGPALPAALAVPVGLAVPCEEDRRHGANVAPRWISASGTRCASSPGRPPGIGLEVARQLQRGGRDASSPPAAATEGIGDLHVAADLAQPGEPERLIAATLERFGRVDCLVNNVGGTEIRKLDELTDADWQRSFELNLMSAVRATRAALPGDARAGARRDRQRLVDRRQATVARACPSTR